MKRRSFFKSILGAIAGLALAQRIALSELSAKCDPIKLVNLQFGDFKYSELLIGTADEINDFVNRWFGSIRSQLPVCTTMRDWGSDRRSIMEPSKERKKIEICNA